MNLYAGADYQCDTCPFRGDASTVPGHEAGIPGGWLGRNEKHTMRRLDKRETSGILAGHIADGRGHNTNMTCCGESL